MISDTSEATKLLDQLPAPTYDSATEATIPFETDLLLTREQEDRLVKHVVERINDMMTESGREEVVKAASNCGGGESGVAKAFRNELSALHAQGIGSKGLKWMVRRSLFYEHFYNNYEERFLPDTVFAQSNLTASLSPRICLQVSGKLKRVFFAADPWLSAAPVGVNDHDLAQKVREFSRYKADQAKLKNSAMTALDMACILGEAVVKTTHLEDMSWHWKTGEILVEADGKTPVFDVEGRYIFRDAMWTTQTIEQQPNPNYPPEVKVVKVLRRDNATIMPPGAQWVRQRVRVNTLHYRGPKSEAIWFTDFLCPLNAESVHKADIVAHLYDADAMEIAAWFTQGRFNYLNNEQQTALHHEKALNTLHRVLTSASPTTGSSTTTMPRTVHGETDTPRASASMVQVAECWLRYDADEDGVQEEICVVIDLVTQRPLYYNFTANITPDGRRPFDVLRCLPVLNRWYGVGMMEYLEPEQLFIDLQVNRWNLSLSRAGKVVFWNPEKTLEGEQDRNLRLNSGATYRLRDGASVEDVIKVVELYASQQAADIKDIISFYMQLMQLKTGVLSVADESISDMNATKLATGIRAIQKAGDEIFASWQEEVYLGLRDVVRKFVGVALARMDRRETWRFTDGDDEVLATLMPEDVANLEVDVQLLLVSDENEKTLQSVTMAITQVLPSFYALPPHAQPAAVPAVRQALRALGVRDADKMAIPMPQMVPTTETTEEQPAEEAALSPEMTAEMAALL